MLKFSDTYNRFQKSTLFFRDRQKRLYVNEESHLQQSKVLDIVMETLISMINGSLYDPHFDDIQKNTSTLLSSNDDILSTNVSQTSLEDFGRHSGLILFIICGVIFAILTTVGNLLVMLSIKIDKQLQTISNYFLFSLAVADITIGIISIPLMTYYTANQYWGLGYAMCQFWLSMDYLMSNASVLNLLLISFDRYFSVTKPLSYRPKRSTKKALLMIACTYIISAILWPPWIIGWPYIEGKFTVEPGACVVQFLETNPYVTVATALAAFYLPVTIMIALYSRVYRETKRRQRQFRLLQAGQMFCPSTEMGATSVIQQLSLPLLLLRGRTSETVQSENSSSFKNKNSFRKKSFPSMEESRLSCFRRCTGKSDISSEESSEVIHATNVEDISHESSFYNKSRQRPSSTPIDKNCDQATVINHADTKDVCNGTSKFRARKSDSTTVLHSYTVLIELPDKSDKRPSVKLSKNDKNTNRNESQDAENQEHKQPNEPKIDKEPEAEKLCHQTSRKNVVQQQNGKHKLNIDHKKSEKERKKNERKQESKAAKTLSAILFAFIMTWTPYNVIVCWEAFFPKTVPTIFFTISYCLCYVNSTINPLCYALCNARFRMTYMRILTCKWKKPKPDHSNLYRHAYLKRI